MKYLTFYIFGLLLIGFRQFDSKATNIEFADKLCIKPIISTEDTTYTVIKFDSVYFWMFKNAKPTDLSANENKELEKILSDCIDNYKYELLDIKKYKRQYVPVINDKGEKEVWINCFCNHFDFEWKNKVVLVEDGGNCYFQLKINLTTKKYYDFSINGNG